MAKSILWSINFNFLLMQLNLTTQKLHKLKFIFCPCEKEPGHIGVVPDPGVAQHVGSPLGHQNFYLVHRAAELQVA